MLLKTVHQWDIDTQDHLNRFREESEEIHRSVVRTIYRNDPNADPRIREEEEAALRIRNENRRTRSQQAGQPEEKPEKGSKKKPKEPPPPVQEPEAEWISEPFPTSREEFLDQMASDLEQRKKRQIQRVQHRGEGRRGTP